MCTRLRSLLTWSVLTLSPGLALALGGCQWLGLSRSTPAPAPAPTFVATSASGPTSALPPAITTVKPATPIGVSLRREQLVGVWYGDQPSKEGGRVQWLMRRAADGTFRVTFRNTSLAGQVEEQTEFGEWGVNATFLITVTRGWVDQGYARHAPSGAAYYWDVYEVQSLANGQLDYRSVESGNIYRTRRVEPDFAFPP